MIRVRLPLKPFLTLVFLLGLLFISLGDTFLPKPLSTYSARTRNQINQMLISAAGQQAKPTADKLKNSRYAKENVGTFFDRALEEAEKQGKAPK
jgi:hypothetical protein